ncbi:MAG TPA: hypothetical protein VMF30_11490 [Pirellulales bacterium]|nr:hypothetical protein [Pirellulales bacterium]
MNVAIWLCALGEGNDPPHHKCQIRCRWECLAASTDQQHLGQLLDLEDVSFDDRVRAFEVTRIITDFVLPFFARTTSLTAIRSIYKTELWPRGCLAYAVAQRLIESDPT